MVQTKGEAETEDEALSSARRKAYLTKYERRSERAPEGPRIGH